MVDDEIFEVALTADDIKKLRQILSAIIAADIGEKKAANIRLTLKGSDVRNQLGGFAYKLLQKISF